jgi:hypothetical protein
LRYVLRRYTVGVLRMKINKPRIRVLPHPEGLFMRRYFISLIYSIE